MKMSKRAKRTLAWLLWAALALIFCHYVTSATMGAWIDARWLPLGLVGAVAGTVAGMTKTKRDDTILAAIFGFLGERFGGKK